MKNSLWYLRTIALSLGGIILVFVLLSNSDVFATPPSAEPAGSQVNAHQGMFFVGEELTYEVSYSIFNLGTVRVQVLDSVVRNGKVTYRTKAFIDSYNIPLVNLHYVFYSEMDATPYSTLFVGYDTKKPEEKPYTKYTFDYENNSIKIEKGTDNPSKITETNAESVTEHQQDGLSLFYFARANLHQKNVVNVPTFVDEKKVNTQINFLHIIGSQEIDAVSYPIETVEFEGKAEFVGIFGLTGAFRGYFSNDNACIPIVAKMKVILGSVHIELKKWNRPGWIPPRSAG